MAILRVKAPINPDEPVIVKPKKKKYDDDLSVQPSAKMIAEQVVKHGVSKVTYLTITFPVSDEELQNQLQAVIPTMVRAEKLTDFYESPADGSPLPDDAEPIKLVKFRCPHTLENIAALYKFGVTHRFVFDGDIAVRALSATEEGRELERMSYAKSNSVFQVAKLAGTPYPFQIAGPAYMIKTKKCINADEMGLGKTIQAILATATAKAYPALFIVPNQLKTAPWKKEWNKWAPRRKSTTMVMDNKNKKLINKSFRVKKKGTNTFEKKKPEVIIVNYDRLGKYMRYLTKVPWKAIVLDESHYVKNRNADRTRACIELVDATKPEYVWLLSGTPIKAKPEHLVSQLRIIDRLKDFGGRGNFMKRYCFSTGSDEDYDLQEIDLKEIARKRHETSIELNGHLRSLCYIRRDKSDVLHDLPDKTRSTLKFKLNAHHRAIYTQIETDLVSYLLDRALQDEKFLKTIKKLSKKEREFAISEYRAAVEYKSARAEILQKIELCKQAAAAGKLEQVKEWIESFLESDEKLVVFASHKIIIRELAEAFPKIHMLITGGQDGKASDQDKKRFKLDDEATIRDAEVARFQNDPKCKLALCMIQAGGVGHTLTAASNVAFIELPWGPTDCDQAEDRCHRIGQKDNVTCHYLLAEDTIDEPIAELIESKRMVVNAVHDGDPLHGMESGSILVDLVKVLTRGKIVLLR
jgi:SWI/SNF-related matrix-associated actin-dependent regulator of chromatin subfamily A-like protein 1